MNKVADVGTGIKDSDREKLAFDLVKVLADTYTLLIKSHVYHWNVVGPLFLPIHQLTEGHYEDLFQAADVIAERIRGLGHPAPLSFSELAPKSSVDEEERSRTTEGMLEQLVEDHEQMVRRLRKITARAADLEDFVTHDMLNGRLAFHEKAIWMLRATLADPSQT